VTPGNLGKGVVNTDKIASGAVRATNIKNGVVTTNKLHKEAVTTAKLSKESVTSGKLGPEVAPLLGTLRSGQTLRGVFDVGGPVGGIARGAVSFQFPLLAKPTVEVLKKGETSANCSGLSGGNAETPQATAGSLCIYLTEEAQLDEAAPLEADYNTRLGFGLVAKGIEEAGAFYAYGQWAVTAP
jgi:hypothetical protein